MTSDWYDKAMELKITYGKTNPYIKSVFSSAWGVLNQRLKEHKSKREIINKNIDVGLSFDNK